MLWFCKKFWSEKSFPYFSYHLSRVRNSLHINEISDIPCCPWKVSSLCSSSNSWVNRFFFPSRNRKYGNNRTILWANFRYTEGRYLQTLKASTEQHQEQTRFLLIEKCTLDYRHLRTMLSVLNYIIIVSILNCFPCLYAFISTFESYF